MAKLDVRLEEIATREHFLATYKDTPKAEKCAQILDNAQVFPLTASSPAMVYLNILGTYVYLSGNLSINTKRDTRDTFQYSAGIARNGLNVPIEEIEEGLGLKLNPAKHVLYLGENGAPYARVLSVMGFHTAGGECDDVETKASTGSELPPYIKRFVSEYKKMNEESKSRVGRLLRDFIAVWFDSKGKVVKGGLRLNLLGQPNEEKMRTEAAYYVGAINIVYPEVGLSMDQLVASPYKNKKSPREITAGYVNVSNEQLLKMVPHRTAPIELAVNVRPQYSLTRYS